MLLRPLQWVLKDWFLVGMIVAITLAVIFPEAGRTGGPLRTELIATGGIFVVFLLHGFGLSTESLRQGVLHWRLHLFVQAFTFGVFPLLWLAFDLTAGRWAPSGLMLGFLFLCALPSTISSSVAMTGVAKGNVAGAIFNASLSSLLGIVLTPLWVALLARTTGESLPLGEAVLKLAGLLLLPLVIGQVLRRTRVGGRYLGKGRMTVGLDRVVILILIYASFCDSIAAGVFRDYGLPVLALAFLGVTVLLALVLSLTTLASRRLGFARGDEIAAVFCGSKKSLATGMPMARILFGADPALGLIVMPLIFYHQLQLMVGAVLAERYARRSSS